MKRFALALALTASAFALSGCLTSKDSKNATVTANAGAYKALPMKGFEDNLPHAVHSVTTNEGPINTRFTVQFTSDEKIIVTDTTAAKTYTFTSDQVRGPSFNEMTLHKMFATQLDNSATVGFGDPGFEAAYVLTPTATSTPEYAIVRLSNDNGQQWLLAGTPTSTALAGNATYKGGYYLSGGSDTSIGDITVVADFAGNADAVNFTLDKHANDTLNTTFGANTVTFTANYDSAARTIDGVAKPVGGGGFYNEASVHGAFFDSGNSTGGLIRLHDTTATHADYHGMYNAVKQ